MERANVGFIGIDDFDSYWSKVRLWEREGGGVPAPVARAPSPTHAPWQDIDNVGIARMCSYLANAADGLG